MTIFVFGSNRLGIHGKGAALEAKLKWGAIQGIGEGIQGHSYAIPTKETPYKTLSLKEIDEYVNTFLVYAYLHPNDIFVLTPIGTGLAGYTHDQIAPMFKNAPYNVIFPEVWKPYRKEPITL